jgi:hypothetical protein
VLRNRSQDGLKLQVELEDQYPMAEAIDEVHKEFACYHSPALDVTHKEFVCYHYPAWMSFHKTGGVKQESTQPLVSVQETLPCYELTSEREPTAFVTFLVGPVKRPAKLVVHEVFNGAKGP